MERVGRGRGRPRAHAARRSSSWPTPSPRAAGSRRASARRATAPSSSSRPTTRDEARRARRWPSSARPRRGAGLPPWPIATGRGDRRGRRRYDGRRGETDDPARLAGRLSVRGAAGAGRLDAAGAARGLRHRRSSPSRTPSPTVRGHLRRPLRRPVRRALPVQPPAGVVLGAAGRQPLEAVHLHLRGAGRAAVAPGADRPRADRDLPPGLQPRAVRPGVEGRVDRRVHGADHRPAHHRPRSRPRTD